MLANILLTELSKTKSVKVNMTSLQIDHNNPKSSLSGSRRCYVCMLAFDTTDKSNFLDHMDDHSEDLKKYKFSNNMRECCKTACKLCGKQFPVPAMRVHTKKVHGMKITEYRTKFNQFLFDMVEKVFHRYQMYHNK